MTGESTYTYLVDYLSGKMENTTILGMGSNDRRVDKLTEAEICDVFERYVYKDGVSDPLFLMDKGERLHIFNGKYYEVVIPEVFEQVIKRVMSRLRIGNVYQKNSYRFISRECMDGMRSSSGSEFKPDRRYIAFNNGILDLENSMLLPFGGGYMTDLHLDLDYRSGWTHPLWDSKLCDIIPDEGMRAALQLFFGCLLLDRDKIKVEYVCFILGMGGNGKSVIVDAVVNTFGSDLFAKFSPEQLFNSQQSLFNLAALEGKIANFCDDVSNKDFSGGDFKSFVSGAEFEARMPYGHNFFKVKAPLLICCANEMPPTTDDSEGFHRRFLTITSCERTWTGKEKDPQLTMKLRAPEVRQAIFNWVLDGYYKVLECHGNIELAASVIETQRAIREDSSSVRRWVRDYGLVPIPNYRKGDSRWRKLSEWYAVYKQYCMDNGERYPQKARSLSKLFKMLGFASERRGDGVYYLIGQEEPRHEDDLAEPDVSVPSGGIYGSLGKVDEDLPF